MFVDEEYLDPETEEIYVHEEIHDHEFPNAEEILITILKKKKKKSERISIKNV